MFVFKITLLTIMVACVAGQDTSDPPSPTPPATTPPPSTGREISIKSSNAADVQFAWDAVQCLTRAYTLHPDSMETVIATFSQLFQLQHSGSWNVHAGCKSLYIAKNTSYIRIDLKVKDSSGTTIISLYN